MAVYLVAARERAIPVAVRRAVLARDGLVCQLCSAELPDESAVHLDHVLHWAAGGENTVDNLRVSCSPCNLGRPGPAVVVRRLAPRDSAYDWIRTTPETRRRLARKRGDGLRLEEGELARLTQSTARMSARQRRAWLR